MSTTAQTEGAIVSEIVQKIESLSPAARETLSIILDTKFHSELKKRVAEMPEMVKRGEYLTTKELFEDV